PRLQEHLMEAGLPFETVRQTDVLARPMRSMSFGAGRRLSRVDVQQLRQLLAEVDAAGYTRGLPWRAEWLALRERAGRSAIRGLGADLFRMMDEINRSGAIAGTEVQVRWHLLRERLAHVAVRRVS